VGQAISINAGRFRLLLFVKQDGFSHVRAALMKPSLTVPIIKGKLTLGTWQQIVFMDFDNRGRDREIVVQVMGE
jgi:secondary thiamine-phosphate synthase enzyme